MTGGWALIGRLGRARWLTLGLLGLAALCWATAPVMPPAGEAAFGFAGAAFWLAGLGALAGTLGLAAALLREGRSGWAVVGGLVTVSAAATGVINGVLLAAVGAAVGARGGGSVTAMLRAIVDGVASQPGLLATFAALSVVPAVAVYWFYGGLRGVPAARHAAAWTLGGLALLRPLIWIAGVLLAGRREMVMETALWIAPIETALHCAGLAGVLWLARDARKTLHARG